MAFDSWGTSFESNLIKHLDEAKSQILEETQKNPAKENTKTASIPNYSSV